MSEIIYTFSDDNKEVTNNYFLYPIQNLSLKCRNQWMAAHAVVLKMTEYQGKPYALDGHRFFTSQMLYGQEYRNLLAEKLQTMGYKVEVTELEKCFFELSAIREDVQQHFSKRRAQIEAEMNKNGEMGSKAAQKAALETRKVKNRVDMEAKRAEWIKEFADLKQALPIKQADAGARMVAAEKVAAFDRAIARLSENSFAWTSAEVKQAVMAEGCITGIKQEDADRMISRSPLVKLQPKTKAGLPAGVYYTTRANIRIERRIVEQVALNKGKMKGIAVEDAAKTLAAVSQANAWELGQEQKNVVEHIAFSKDRFIAVRGLAGTGKTFTLNASREVLEAHGYQVKGMSATGQAADELSKDSNIKECSTIHHALNTIERKAGNSVAGEDYAAKSTWNSDGIRSSGKPTVWFMDEASLTDNKLFYSTMKMATATGDEVVFIGDDRQMPPVGVGNAYANLIQSGKISMTELSDIRRQKDAPERLKAVVEAVKGETKVSLNIISKDIVEIPTRVKRLNAVVRAYTDLSAAEQAQTMVLTARNADRTEINNRIRKQLIKQGLLEQGKSFTVQYGKDKTLQEREFSQGDKVVFLQNDNKLGVKNGTKGNITKVDGNSIVIDIGKNKTITVDILTSTQLNLDEVLRGKLEKEIIQIL